MAPGDGDVVLVPFGYHLVGAPTGHDCYYLNIMAGLPAPTEPGTSARTRITPS